MDKDKPNMGHSVFNMVDVEKVLLLPLLEAKTFALNILENSTANIKNKTSIRAMITSSKSSKRIATTMTNLILAHPSEGLKVV